MDFLSGDDGLTTEDISYSMTGVELELSAEAMARAPSSGGAVPDALTDLPEDLPQVVEDLTIDVTGEQPTRFQKAQALQEWFRESGGFTYDLNADEGNGSDDLARFLTEGKGGRTGYCEQFASAMAVMARVIGIPSRVAVGFLTPEQIGDETWEYSAWDLHAWPELYFPGSGWVRFEPTPAGRASGVPSYTTERVATINEPTGPASPSASDLLPERNPAASEQQPDTASDQDANKDDAGFPWLPVGGGTAGVLLVVGALLLPRTVRAPSVAGPDRCRTGAGVGRAPRHRDRPARPVAREPVTARDPRPPGRPPRRTRGPGDGRAPAARSRRGTRGRDRAGPDRARPRAAALRPRRPGAGRAGQRARDGGRVPARRRHPDCAAPGRVVAPVGAEPQALCPPPVRGRADHDPPRRRRRPRRLRNALTRPKVV